MDLTEKRIRELELPINRTSYHLSRGTPEYEIVPTLIGHDVTLQEIPAIIEISKKRTADAKFGYRRHSRKSSLIFMALGATMLSLIWIGTSGGAAMPHGRFGGRAILGFIIGVGALGYGAWRWIDPSYKE